MLVLEHAKPAAGPGASLTCTEQSLTLITDDRKELYATCVGNGIYLGVDRRDIRWAMNELARGMTEPRECDYTNLNILGRHLKGSLHFGRMTKLNTASSAPGAGPIFDVYADANFGGSTGMDRRSTDCYDCGRIRNKRVVSGAAWSASTVQC